MYHAYNTEFGDNRYQTAFGMLVEGALHAEKQIRLELTNCHPHENTFFIAYTVYACDMYI